MTQFVGAPDNVSLFWQIQLNAPDKVKKKSGENLQMTPVTQFFGAPPDNVALFWQIQLSAPDKVTKNLVKTTPVTQFFGAPADNLQEIASSIIRLFPHSNEMVFSHSNILASFNLYCLMIVQAKVASSLKFAQ